MRGGRRATWWWQQLMVSLHACSLCVQAHLPYWCKCCVAGELSIDPIDHFHSMYYYSTCTSKASTAHRKRCSHKTCTQKPRAHVLTPLCCQANSWWCAWRPQLPGIATGVMNKQSVAPTHTLLCEGKQFQLESYLNRVECSVWQKAHPTAR